MKTVCSVSIMVTFIVIAKCQEDGIAFPEMHQQNQEGRVPLFAPKKCPKNQLFYPGDQKSDWVCDCQPGYIYDPRNDACYHAFKQGPCKSGEHLITKRHKYVPECVANPCQEGFARFGDNCYEMGKPNGPCGLFEAGGGIFDVNPNSLQVECLKGTDLFSQKKNCLPGSKRDRNNKCQD